MPGLRVLVGGEAGTVHARIQLEPAVQRLGQLRRLQLLQLPGRVDDQPQILVGTQRQLAGMEEALQQQDRQMNARLAQLQRLLDAGHGKAVRLCGQRSSAIHRAMSVGIRLDHGQRTAPAEGAGNPVVVPQCRQIDDNLSRAHGVPY